MGPCSCFLRDRWYSAHSPTTSVCVALWQVISGYDLQTNQLGRLLASRDLGATRAGHAPSSSSGSSGADLAFNIE